MAFGTFDIVYKIASTRDVNPLTFLIVQSATAQILINLYVALHEKYPLNRVVLQIAPLCGVLFASASLSMLKALEEVDVSLLSPFIQMSLVVSYRKLLGITIVALSVLLLSEDLFRRLSNLWAG